MRKAAAVNTDIDKLEPGTFGVSHGGGTAGELIRHATGSWAGHAFLYLGGGLIVQGQPPQAATAPAASHGDAIWAWRMWDYLRENGWTADQAAAAQAKVVERGRQLIGCSYDFEAYGAFTLMVLKLRTAGQLSPLFRRDAWRVCSALVADAVEYGGVPLHFESSDGPGLAQQDDLKVIMPPNLVAPGMLLGLSQRLGWS
jgi:hypothetical protein